MHSREIRNIQFCTNKIREVKIHREGVTEHKIYRYLDKILNLMRCYYFDKDCKWTKFVFYIKYIFICDDLDIFAINNQKRQKNDKAHVMYRFLFMFMFCMLRKIVFCSPRINLIKNYKVKKRCNRRLYSFYNEWKFNRRKFLKRYQYVFLFLNIMKEN